MDLVKARRGRLRRWTTSTGTREKADEGLELWPADRVQLAVQGLVLRENGYRCEEGTAYYRKTRQRVRVAFDEVVMRGDRSGLSRRRGRWRRAGEIPAPLVDSPKCPGCSLVGICLPDETNLCAGPRNRAWPLLGTERLYSWGCSTGRRVTNTREAPGKRRRHVPGIDPPW